MTRPLASEPLFSEAQAGDADASDCAAFNAAFRELGLNWRWSPDMYRDLLRIATERDRIRAYLESTQPALLQMYDTDFLIDAIDAAKARCLKALFADQPNPADAGWP